MTLIITGPRCVGKTHLKNQLTKNFEVIEGHDVWAKEMKKHGGISKAVRSGISHQLFFKTTNLIKNCLEEKPDFLTLPASVFSSEDLVTANQNIKACENNQIVLMLPNKDFDESVQILFARERARGFYSDMTDEELMGKVKDDYQRVLDIIKPISSCILYSSEIKEGCVFKIQIRAPCGELKVV